MSREHVESGDCWCNPYVEQPCPDCDGDSPSCWRCGGTGWVPEYDPVAGPTHTIHNEGADRV